MSWAKIDDQLHTNEKMLECSLAARGLWLICLSWVADKETDGNLPRAIVKLHAGAQWQELSEELVAAGLWETTSNGWAFHDYLTYNRSKADLDKEREETAERKARWKAKQATQSSATRSSSRENTEGTQEERVRNGVPHSVPNTVPHSEGTLHPDPEPDPVLVLPSGRTTTRAGEPPQPRGIYPPEAPLPLAVQEFIQRHGGLDSQRWEEELRLDLAGRELSGPPSAYMLGILRRWEREGLPRRGAPPSSGPSMRDTPRSRTAALRQSHAQKLAQELAELGFSPAGGVQ